MKILIFGVQGAGKSTVGKYIAEELETPFIATGDIFRELKDNESSLGELVRSKIDEGELVPDETTMEIVNRRLKQEDVLEGFVLDGAPRNLAQVKMFKSSIDLLVLVNLNGEEAVKRLVGRGRHDDTKEKIDKRISWYESQTKPVIDFYRSKDIEVIEIDNTKSEEEVQKNVNEQFKNYKRN